MELHPLFSLLSNKGLLDILEDSFLDRDSSLKAAIVLEKTIRPDFDNPWVPLFDFIVRYFPSQRRKERWYHQIQEWWFYLSVEKDGTLVALPEPDRNRLHKKFIIPNVNSETEAVRELEELAASLQSWYPLKYRTRIYRGGEVVQSSSGPNYEARHSK